MDGCCAAHLQCIVCPRPDTAKVGEAHALLDSAAAAAADSVPRE